MIFYSPLDNVHPCLCPADCAARLLPAFYSHSSPVCGAAPARLYGSLMGG